MTAITVYMPRLARLVNAPNSYGYVEINQPRFVSPAIHFVAGGGDPDESNTVTVKLGTVPDIEVEHWNGQDGPTIQSVAVASVREALHADGVTLIR